MEHSRSPELQPLATFHGQLICRSLPIPLKSCSLDQLYCPFSSFILSTYSSSQLIDNRHRDKNIHLMYNVIYTSKHEYYLLIHPYDLDMTSGLNTCSQYSFEKFISVKSSTFTKLCPCLQFLFDHDRIIVYGSSFFGSKMSITEKIEDPANNFLHAEDISMKYVTYLRPKSMSQKDQYSHLPVNVKGIIIRIYSYKSEVLWIELLGKTKFAKGDSLFIYISSWRSTASNDVVHFSSLTVGDSMIFYSVYPVYLWGRLHGFAMTARSWFDVHFVSSRFYPSLLPRCQSYKIQPAHREIFISPEIRNTLISRCSVFVAWAAYLNRRVKQCISSSSTYRYESHDYGRIFAILLTAWQLPSIFEIPTNITWTNCFWELDNGPLYSVRSGQDLDYLCTFLPEVVYSVFFLTIWQIWSCGMVRQFAINTHQRNVGKCSIDSKESSGDCLLWMEWIQSSKSRHETYSCNHPVGVLASVVDISLLSTVWFVALSDSVGEKLIALVSPSSNSSLPILRASVSRPTVLLIKNSAVVIQSSAFRTEECIKCLLITSEEFIQFVDFPCESSLSQSHCTAPEGVANSLFELQRMTSFFHTHFLNKNLSFNGLFGSEHVSSFDEIFTMNVREVLLHEIFPKEHKKLSCVTGIITRIQFIPSSVSDTTSKKTKVEYVDKYLFDIRDLSYPDIIKVYLPVSLNTSELCLVGMVVCVFNSTLKCSSNGKNIYLECKLDNSFIGLFNFIPPQPFSSTPTASIQFETKPPPDSSFFDLMFHSYRNRCLWKVKITVTFIREIEVYRMCTFCCQPIISIGETTCSHCQNCHRNTSGKIWWKCVCLVDDGTAEAYMCFDGHHALELLEACICYSRWCRCDPDKTVSFVLVQRLLEEVVSKYFLHLKSQNMLSSNETSPFSRFSNDPPSCICQRYEFLSSFMNGSLPRTISTDILLQLLYILNDIIHICALSCYCEVTVRLIHSKASTQKKIQEENPLCSGQPRCEKVVSLQKLNDPYWTIENVEISSESFEQLRFQCQDLLILNNMELSNQAWKILKDI